MEPERLIARGISLKAGRRGVGEQDLGRCVAWVEDVCQEDKLGPVSPEEAMAEAVMVGVCQLN